jgi:CelD/BcsL family acetyltransferase involved in cellulose biosynthesis
MPATRVRHIRTLEELDRIEDIWRELERANDKSSLFQSWSWNRTWCEFFLSQSENKRLDVRLIENSEGRALGILPFFKKSLVGPMIELTQFLGHRMSYQNDILLSEPKNSELTKKIVDLMVADMGYRTIIHLRHLDEESSFTQELVRRGIAESQCTRLKVKADPTAHDPSLRFGRSTRRRYRGQINKLKREYGIEFHVRSGDEFMDAFENLVGLHQRRFASKKQTTQFSGANLLFRKNAMARLKEDGIFEIVQLRAGGGTIASTLMARDKGRYFCIQTGFDPEFANYSPMRILLTETIRRGFEDLGCRSFDLGPGYEQYKFDWKPYVGKNYSCCIGGPGPYAKSMAALYSFAFRRSLPGTTKKADG